MEVGYGLDRWHGDGLLCPFLSSWARYIMSPGTELEASTLAILFLLSNTRRKVEFSDPPGWEDP